MQTTVADSKAGPPWRYRVVVKKSAKDHGVAAVAFIFVGMAFLMILVPGNPLGLPGAAYPWFLGGMLLALFILMGRTLYLLAKEENTLVEEVTWHYGPPRQWLAMGGPCEIIAIPAADGSLPPLPLEKALVQNPRARRANQVSFFFLVLLGIVSLGSQVLHPKPPWENIFLGAQLIAMLAAFAAIGYAQHLAYTESPPAETMPHRPEPEPLPPAVAAARRRTRAGDTALAIAAALILHSLAMASFAPELWRASFPWLPLLPLLAALLGAVLAFAIPLGVLRVGTKGM